MCTVYCTVHWECASSGSSLRVFAPLVQIQGLPAFLSVQRAPKTEEHHAAVPPLIHFSAMVRPPLDSVKIVKRGGGLQINR